MFHTKYVPMFMTHLQTKFTFTWFFSYCHTMILFYILQTYDLNKYCTFFEELISHKISGPCGTSVTLTSAVYLDIMLILLVAGN